MRQANGERSRFREWWPEGVAGIVIILIGAAPTGGALFLAGFIAVFVCVGELMGGRHKRLPLHDTLNGIYAHMEQMDSRVAAAAPAAEPERPELYVVRD